MRIHMEPFAIPELGYVLLDKSYDVNAHTEQRRTGKRPLNILEALPEPQDAKVLANSQSKPVKQLETSEEGMKNVKLPATLDKRSSTEEKVQGDRRTASSIFKAFAAKSKPKFQSQESGGSSTSTMGVNPSTHPRMIRMIDWPLASETKGRGRWCVFDVREPVVASLTLSSADGRCI